MTSEDSHPAGNNPHIFFDRLSPEAARWFADLCDEAAAKGPEGSYEFRRLICDLASRSVRDGITFAFEVADHFISPNHTFAKWVEGAYEKYDRARATIIETGPDTTQTGSQQVPPTDVESEAGNDAVGASGNGSTGTTAQGNDRGSNGGASSGASEAGTGSNKGPGCGALGSGGITVVAGGQDGNSQNTGIGHQGTLFTVRYAEFRLAFPANHARAKEEHKQLIHSRTDVNRRILTQEQLLKDMELVAGADEAIENLANKHRDLDTIGDMLRAAGMRPENIGLTERSVTWLDRQIKHAS